MKQIFKTLAVAFAFVAAASCAKEVANPAEDQPSVKLVPTTIEASIDATKATVTADGKVLWQENDAIAVWVDGAKYEMTLTAGAGTKEATFKGDLPEGGKISAAVSPASAATATPGVPAPVFKQTIATGATCDPAALIMTAGAPVDKALSFHNACGAGRFTLPGAGFTTIMVYCAEGKVEVNLPGTAGTFDVFLPAATYTNILIAATTVTDVTYGVQLPKDLVIKRSVITNVGTLSGAPCAVITSAGELQDYLSAPATNAFIVKDINLADITLTPCESLGYTLDGMGHSLKNWNVTAPMITTATAESVIKNIVIDETCAISPVPGRFGALAGTAAGLVENCVNKAPVSATNNESTQYQCGALVGRLEGTMKNCVNSGELTFVLSNSTTAPADAQTNYVGGLVGILGQPQSDPSVIRMEGCRNEGNVNYKVVGSLDGNTSRIAHGFIGGVFGATGVNKPAESETSGYVKNYGIVKDCENTGNVEFLHPDGGSGMYAMTGGISGYVEGVLDGCINRGAVSYKNSATVANAKPALGGIAGAIAHSASNCTNYGDVFISGMFANGGGATTNTALGMTYSTLGGCFGCVGVDATSIDNCDNEGKVTADTQMAASNSSAFSYGGIVGYYVSGGELKNCDNKGEMTITSQSKTADVGGVVGRSKAAVSSCTNSGKIYAKQNTSRISAPTEAIINAGGVVGYNYFSVKDCTNNGSKLEALASGGSRIGGVVGMYGAGTETCSGCTNNADLVYTRSEDVAANLYLGGVIGCDNVTANIENCKNTGNLSATLNASTAKSFAGGVVALAKPAASKTLNIDDCENTGNILIDGGNMVTQFYLGGVVGDVTTGSKVYVNRCINRGEVKLLNVNCPGSFVYVGGVQGGYETAGPNLDACENYGDVISACASKMRMGGISGANNSTATKSVQEGNVTMSAAAAGSMVGLLGGYFSGTKMEGSTVKGTLTLGTLGSTNASAGGVIGENGTTATRTWHNLVVDAVINTGGQTAVRTGYFIGKVFDNSNAGTGGLNLGKDGNPVTFKSSCSLDGAAIPAAPTSADLAGALAAATTPFNLANVVVE